jgi:hypothetical protein
MQKSERDQLIAELKDAVAAAGDQHDKQAQAYALLADAYRAQAEQTRRLAAVFLTALEGAL